MTEPGEFSVCQFFANDSYEYVLRSASAKDAVHTAKRFTESVGARIGTTARVIITDADDFTVFEWKFGEGVMFPPHDGQQFVAGDRHRP